MAITFDQIDQLLNAEPFVPFSMVWGMHQAGAWWYDILDPRWGRVHRGRGEFSFFVPAELRPSSYHFSNWILHTPETLAQINTQDFAQIEMLHVTASKHLVDILEYTNADVFKPFKIDYEDAEQAKSIDIMNRPDAQYPKCPGVDFDQMIGGGGTEDVAIQDGWVTVSPIPAFSGGSGLRIEGPNLLGVSKL